MGKTKLEAVEIYGFQFSLTPLHPSQKALDRAEAQEIRLNEALAESETALREAEHRLRRVRGVVRAAVRANDTLRHALDMQVDPRMILTAKSKVVDNLIDTTDALLPEDRAWAEGKSDL